MRHLRIRTKFLTRNLTPCLAALAIGVFALPDLVAAQEQEDQEKAVMTVQNFRNETITMDFSYVFREYSWKLMERQIGIDGDLIYKFPTSLPGCEYLIDWDIDNARLTVSNANGVICTKDVSICERRTITVEVRNRVCYMKSVN